jgi:hypothetical protein
MIEPAHAKNPRAGSRGIYLSCDESGGTGALPYFKKRRTTTPFFPCRTGKGRHPVKLFCLLLGANHFHFVIEATHQQSLSQFMQWLLTSHVRCYHRHFGSSGHVWQGRFSGAARRTLTRPFRPKAPVLSSRVLTPGKQTKPTRVSDARSLSSLIDNQWKLKSATCQF